MYYPWYGSQNFVNDLLSKKEIYENSSDIKNGRCLENHQYLASNYMNPKSPYDSLLLYFQTGTGKTLTAISIAENFILDEASSKIIVITKNEDLSRDFKSQLFSICSRYSSQEEKDIISTGTPEEKSHILSKLEKKINRNYSFIHHEQFKNSVLGTSTKSPSLTNLNGRIIIVDEFHNLTGNKGYDALLKILKNSKNYRLVLMSATPVFDKITDAFQISNLLNRGFNQLPILPLNLSKLGYVKRNTDVENISIFSDGDIYMLSETGKNILKRSLHGKVIYLKTNVENFPTYSDIGDHIEIGGYKSSVKVISCEMSNYQESRYLKVYEATKSNQKDFNKNLEYASSIIYPDNGGKIMIGGAGYERYVDRETSFLLEKNIRTYSTKLYNLLKNIQSAKGKIFIFSNYISDDGIGLVKACLSANNIFSVKTLTSSKSAKDRQKIIDSFNDPSNDDGSKIQILLASKVVSEGVTLKNVRQVHIYEPAWNFSTLDQVIGRAIRNNSHSRLQEKDRTVEIFRYCAVPKNISLSSDASKYIKAGRKDKYIKQFERMVAKSAFSCSILKSRNISDRFSDGSRECDYDSCKYTCDVEYSPGKIDSSTYSVFHHNKELYHDISKQILSLFKNSNTWSLEDLARKLKLDEYIISSTMKTLMKTGSKITLNKNYYTINNHTAISSKKYLEDYNFKSTRSSHVFKPNTKTIDGEFKVFLKKTAPGKICKSYSIDEIINFFKIFKIGEAPVKNEKGGKPTKSDLCKIISQRLNNAVRISIPPLNVSTKIKEKNTIETAIIHSTVKSTPDRHADKYFRSMVTKKPRLPKPNTKQNIEWLEIMAKLERTYQDNLNTSKSKSPSTSKSKSPSTPKSKSPSTSKSKSPNTSKSKSPNTSKSKSPITSKTKIPFGKIIDGNFKIFLKSSVRGKICTSFSKDEILGMFKKFNLVVPSPGTKEKLCEILKLSLDA